MTLRGRKRKAMIIFVTLCNILPYIFTAVTTTLTYLCEEYDWYPLVIGNHLPVVGVKLRYWLGPRQIEGVLHPAIARHELAVRFSEMYRCPTRDRVAYVLQRIRNTSCTFCDGLYEWTDC